MDVYVFCSTTLCGRERERKKGKEDLYVDIKNACTLHCVYELYVCLCTCTQCYSGDKCETFNPDCVVVVHGGDPLVFEDYWVANPQVTVSMDAAYRMSAEPYSSAERCLAETGNNAAACGMLPELEATIRMLHRVVGNAAVSPEYHIVLANGSTQLINAAAFALSNNATETVIHAGSPPWYGDYKSTATFFNSKLFRFSDAGENLSGKRVVEFITHPNNPDGKLRTRTVGNSIAVWDHAYYWPHFTPIQGKVGEGDRYRDTDVVMFTLSKMTGHAGTRLGWAITRDAETARRMSEFVSMTTGAVPREVQLRANALLDHIVQTKGAIFKYASDEMQRRWKRLDGIFEDQDIFAFAPREPFAVCDFFGKEMSHSPAYGWFTCLRRTEADFEYPAADVAEKMKYFGIPEDPKYARDMKGCEAHLLAFHNISGTGPLGYGASRDSLRLELLERPEDFDLLADKLEAMVKMMTE